MCPWAVWDRQSPCGLIVRMVDFFLLCTCVFPSSSSSSLSLHSVFSPHHVTVAPVAMVTQAGWSRAMQQRDEGKTDREREKEPKSSGIHFSISVLKGGKGVPSWGPTWKYWFKLCIFVQALDSHVFSAQFWIPFCRGDPMSGQKRRRMRIAKTSFLFWRCFFFFLWLIAVCTVYGAISSR